MRAQALSIYLLKDGETVESAIIAGARLRRLKARALPPGAVLLGLEGEPQTPDWCDYLEVEEDLQRSSLGAILFVPAKKRLFAITFGHAYHKLDEDAYEHDFGLQFILNAAQPDKLRSADICEPGAARLRRTQGADESDLTLLDFKYDAEVLKSITARVQERYKGWFDSATGGASLRLHIKERGPLLGKLCEVLLGAYLSETWKKNFPGAQNIARVREPALIQQLDGALLKALIDGSPHLHLAVPEIIDHHGMARARFSGAGGASAESEIFLKPYLDYLADKKVDISAMTIAALKKHKLHVLMGEEARKTYRVYRALMFETKIAGTNDTFHLLDRAWYRAKGAFMDKLHSDLDRAWIASPFPAYAHACEGDYNVDFARTSPGVVLLDKTNVAPQGMTPVEPADHIFLRQARAVLVHVKVSSFSFKLSHLFNQGTTATELLRENDAARTKLKRIVNERAPVEQIHPMIKAIDARKFAVVYAIVSHKDPADKAMNLPLFSRITLRRSIKALRAMDTEARFCFIPTAAPVATPAASKKSGGPSR
ncbi:MAG: DUF6119 family protein [Hyphomonadaceae bacterium]|jgi:uncharacterized protein (TIGR04141 family)